MIFSASSIDILILTCEYIKDLNYEMSTTMRSSEDYFGAKMQAISELPILIS